MGGWTLKQRLMSLPPTGLLTLDAILILFGAFMITPIMSKMVLNTALLLRDNVARPGWARYSRHGCRPINDRLEHEGVGSADIGATAAVAPALSIGYGLVANHLNEP